MPIKGFLDRYEISNHGSIRSLVTNNKILNNNTYNLKISDDKRGYKYVSLKTLSGKSKFLPIHRLMALHFITNPENKSFVNHKNGIKGDNRIENLEWVTPSENSLHSYKIGTSVNANRKIVLDTASGIFYDSINDAAKAFNIRRVTLTNYLNGKTKINKTSLVLI